MKKLDIKRNWEWKKINRLKGRQRNIERTKEKKKTERHKEAKNEWTKRIERRQKSNNEWKKDNKNWKETLKTKKQWKM